MAKSFSVTEVINGTQYFVRAFPKNPQKQFQTELGGAIGSVIPKSGQPISNLPIGSLVKLVGVDETRFNNKFEIIDRNHYNYPDNTTTIWSKNTSYSDLAGHYDYGLSKWNQYLVDYINSLPTSFTNNVVSTPISFKVNTSLSTLNSKAFPPGGRELWLTMVAPAPTQSPFQHLTDKASRIKYRPTGAVVGYPTRDSRSSTSDYIVNVYGEVMSVTPISNAIPVVCIMNVLNNLMVSEQPDADGYYIIQA